MLDLVGGETTAKSLGVLKPGGVLVSLLGKPDQAAAEKAGVTAIGQMTVTDTPHLNRLATLVDAKKIDVYVDAVFSLDQVRDAFKHDEQDHCRGKVVLKIK